MASDADYFRRRAREERLAALIAGKGCVRLRHLEFAEAYEFRIRELSEDQSRSTLAELLGAD
jgi:hypothetical protein